jgi:hypothetical protein
MTCGQLRDTWQHCILRLYRELHIYTKHSFFKFWEDLSTKSLAAPDWVTREDKCIVSSNIVHKFHAHVCAESKRTTRDDMSCGNYSWRSTPRRRKWVCLEQGLQTSTVAGWVASKPNSVLSPTTEYQHLWKRWTIHVNPVYRNQQTSISMQPTIPSTSRHINPMRIIMNDFRKFKACKCWSGNS